MAPCQFRRPGDNEPGLGRLLSTGPAGTVTFSVGTVKLCSATLVPYGPDVGRAACSSTKAPVGHDTVTASYRRHSPHSRATATLVVDSRGTTTTVTVSPGVAGLGTDVTYRATVTGAGSDPTGAVNFTVTGVTG